MITVKMSKTAQISIDPVFHYSYQTDDYSNISKFTSKGNSSICSHMTLRNTALLILTYHAQTQTS